MRGHILAAAVMATVLTAFAQPAAAQQYRTYQDGYAANDYECERSRDNRTAGGAVIGGIVGALLGRDIADRGVRDEGTGLGAVVGAVAGGAIGRSTARCDDYYAQRDDRSYGRAGYPDDGYYRGDDDLYGGPYEDGYYRDRDRGYDDNCRMGERTIRDPYGREYTEDVLMCRGRDGVWRPAA